jgi:hypothetical protein
LSDVVKITPEAAGAAFLSADNALCRSVRRVDLITARIEAVKAELDAGAPGTARLLRKLASLTADKLKATNSMVAHLEIFKFANDLLQRASDAEERSKNG